MSDETVPSKTQRKKQVAALQDLGVELVALSDERLAAIELPEALRDAVEAARRIRTFEARRRQMQYIGKLMRHVDAGPIRAALAALRARYTSAPMHAAKVELIIVLVSISDRAAQGAYRDEGLPALEDWLRKALASPAWRAVKRLIPDEQPAIEAALKELVDKESCHLVLTTGGTGPAARDVTPEATLAVADKVMPGFGEQMRQVSLRFVPTAILSRQVAVIRRQTLIINLPGQPKAIKETLEGLKDDKGGTVVNGIFAAVPYCIDLIGGPYIETHEGIVKAFRPKSAIRSKKL